MSKASTQTLHVLVLGDLRPDQELAQWIVAHTLVEHVHSFDAAVEALRREPFDFVITRAEDFIPLEDIHAARQAEAIIDSVHQGIGIVDESGSLEWANPKMLSFSDEVRERVCRCCTETFRWAETGAPDKAQIRGRRFGFTTEDSESYEITATPVIDLNERITQVAAVVRNTTNARRLQERIDAIDRAGRELLSLDIDQIARLDAQERLALLEQKMIRCSEDLLNFDTFEIRILNKNTNMLELVMASGIPAAHYDIDLDVSNDSNGICCYVASRGKSYICPDTAKDPRYLPCVEGARSSLTVPLLFHDTVVGVANFESTRLAAFNEDARQFAEIFARYVALALHLLELLVSEQQTTTGRLGCDVMSEITGPLNDIVTDVESLVEDYIGHDDLRHRLRTISENAVRIRETVKDLTSTQAGVRGVRPGRKQLDDPVLRGKRLLIADDEDTIRETVRDVLMGYGCLVDAVKDGDEAIKLVSQTTYDLVLSDIKMPGKSGYQVFEAAKNHNPKTPVILTTGFGYDPNHSIVRARREGLAAVLFKPFKVDQLLNELRMALTSIDD